MPIDADAKENQETEKELKKGQFTSLQMPNEGDAAEIQVAAAVATAAHAQSFWRTSNKHPPSFLVYYARFNTCSISSVILAHCPAASKNSCLQQCDSMHGDVGAVRILAGSSQLFNHFSSFDTIKGHSKHRARNPSSLHCSDCFPAHASDSQPGRLPCPAAATSPPPHGAAAL
jgi:hypothetical protein